MTISYLSYTTSDHPPCYQSFITILIFRKKVAHYMILLKSLSCIKASFSLQKRRDILMNLGAITLLSLSYSIAVYAISLIFSTSRGLWEYRNCRTYSFKIFETHVYTEYKKSYSISYMVFNYGETGRFTLSVHIYSRMVSNWAKFFLGPEK